MEMTIVKELRSTHAAKRARKVEERFNGMDGKGRSIIKRGIHAAGKFEKAAGLTSDAELRHTLLGEALRVNQNVMAILEHGRQVSWLNGIPPEVQFIENFDEKSMLPVEVRERIEQIRPDNSKVFIWMETPTPQEFFSHIKVNEKIMELKKLLEE